MKRLAVIVVVIAAVNAAYGAEKGSMALSSPAFTSGGPIPPRYTCDGGEASPPLLVGNVPAGTKSLALIAEDPDAPGGTWTHWVAWNIPPTTKSIGENRLPEGAVAGTNGWKKTGYGGPCPPSGSHRYVFTLYALDAPPSLAGTAGKEELVKSMKGHVIGQGSLTGTYRRR